MSKSETFKQKRILKAIYLLIAEKTLSRQWNDRERLSAIAIELAELFDRKIEMICIITKTETKCPLSENCWAYKKHELRPYQDAYGCNPIEGCIYPCIPADIKKENLESLLKIERKANGRKDNPSTECLSGEAQT